MNKLLQLRSNEWWQSKVALYMGFAYAVISWLELSLPESWLKLIGLLLWLVAMAGLGYLINEFSDKKDDIKAGKRNLLNNSRPLQVLALAILLLTLAVGVSFLFHFYLLLITMTQLIAFLLYSVKPFRLKNQLLFAIILDAIYAYLLPLLYVLILFEYWVFPHILWLLSWAILVGVRSIVHHHFADRKNDRKINAANIFNKHAHLAIALLNVLLVAELLMLIGWLWLAPNGVWPLIFLILFIADTFLIWHSGQWTTHFKLANRVGGIKFNFYYEQRLPVLWVLLVAWQEPWFIILFFMHFLLFKPDLKRIFAVMVSLYFKTVVQFYHHVVLKYGYKYGHMLKKRIGLIK